MIFSRYRLWQRSHLLPSTDSFCSSNSQSLLPRAYATGANSHFVSLSFQSVTNCPDCKSFVLKFMQHAGGGACVYPLSSFPQVSPLVTRHSPLTHAESTLADTPQLLENATTLSLLECALTEVSVLSPFRMNTYKKNGGGGAALLSSAAVRAAGAGPSHHRPGTLGRSQIAAAVSRGI